MKLLKEYSLTMLGLPYKWGGDDAIEGFDCSGLIIELMQSCGMLPRKYDNTAQGLYNHFKKFGEFGKSGLGALVFYGKSNTEITHIAMMLDEQRIIEAGGGNSRTISEEIAAKQNAYARIRTYNSRADVVAVVMPNYPGFMRK